MDNSQKQKDISLNNLNNILDDMLEDKNQLNNCNDDVCVVKNDKSLIERMNKKIITEDGRQLLI